MGTGLGGQTMGKDREWKGKKRRTRICLTARLLRWHGIGLVSIRKLITSPLNMRKNHKWPRLIRRIVKPGDLFRKARATLLPGERKGSSTPIGTCGKNLPGRSEYALRGILPLGCDRILAKAQRDDPRRENDVAWEKRMGRMTR